MYLRETGMWKWRGLSGPEFGPVAGSCEHGNELPASIRGGEFLVAERLSVPEEELCSVELIITDRQHEHSSIDNGMSWI
jgi:hypothetical protein